MLEKILQYGAILSVFIFIIGLSEYFTATPGEKWFPGMNFSLFKLIPEDLAKKFMSGGIVVFLVFITLLAIVKNLGL